jgi:hypothetical protein
MRTHAVVGTLGLALVAAACASIVHGTKQEVRFASTPPGATVFVDAASSGTTPVALKLARKSSHLVRIELDGYQPHEMMLKRGTSGWVWGNIAFGGLIGVIVDGSNGAMFKLTPAQVDATLASETSGASRTGDRLYIAVVLRADPRWEKIGQLEKTAAR